MMQYRNRHGSSAETWHSTNLISAKQAHSNEPVAKHVLSKDDEVIKTIRKRSSQTTKLFIECNRHSSNKPEH